MNVNLNAGRLVTTTRPPAARSTAPFAADIGASDPTQSAGLTGDAIAPLAKPAARSAVADASAAQPSGPGIDTAEALRSRPGSTSGIAARASDGDESYEAKMKALFAKYDADGDSKLSAGEFGKMDDDLNGGRPRLIESATGRVVDAGYIFEVQDRSRRGFLTLDQMLSQGYGRS